MKWFLAVLRVGNDVQQKGWYASKTIWFNILSLVAAIGALKGLHLNAEDITMLAAGVSTAGNIWLRFRTNTAVGAKTIPATVQPPVEAPDTSTTSNDDNPLDPSTIMG